MNSMSKCLSFDQLIDEYSSEENYKELIKNLQLIINKAKQKYSEIVQWGAKTGQTYFEHANNGVYIILQMQDYFFGDTVHNDRAMLLLKLHILSYIVHDLNKIIDDKEKKSEDIWTQSTLIGELEKINDDKCIDFFLPDWKSHINDMISLIRGHDHTWKNGECLFSDVIPSYNPDYSVTLTKHELQRGCKIMLFTDIIDLIHSPSAKKIGMHVKSKDGKWYDKDGNPNMRFIDYGMLLERLRVLLSDLCGDEMVMDTVQVTMFASSFTNIMMNTVLSTLSSKWKIHPLKVFTNGAIVFGSRKSFDKAKSAMQSLKEDIGKSFIENIENLFDGKYENLITLTGQGIKFDEFIFKQPNNIAKIEKIFRYTFQEKKIGGLSFDHSDNDKANKSSRWKNRLSIKKYLDSETLSNPIFNKWKLNIDKWDRADENLRNLMKDEELWKVGRMVHTCYVSYRRIVEISTNSVPKNVADIMKTILEKLGILEDLKDVYNKGDGNFYAYDGGISMITGDLLVNKYKRDSDYVLQCIIDILKDATLKYPIKDNWIPDPIMLMDRYIKLFSIPQSSANLIQHNESENKEVCCVCGQRLKEAEEWKAQFVSDGFPVQKFSNFLDAGKKKEPKRVVCSPCKFRFYVEKMLPIIAPKNIYYPIFYYRNGIPYYHVQCIQSELNSERKELLEKGKKAFRSIDNKSYIDISKYHSKVNITERDGYGYLLPNFILEICGSIPMRWIDDNSRQSEMFFDLMQNVLEMSYQLNIPATVTKVRNECESLIIDPQVMMYVQDTPQIYRWCISEKMNENQTHIVREILYLVTKISWDVFPTEGKSGLRKSPLTWYVKLFTSITRGKLEAINCIMQEKRENAYMLNVEKYLSRIYELQSQIGDIKK